MSDRVCGCGCGARLDGLRADAIYANSACRARQTRRRQGVEPDPDTYRTFIHRVTHARPRMRPERRPPRSPREPVQP